jgi:hypothetical protein
MVKITTVLLILGLKSLVAPFCTAQTGVANKLFEETKARAESGIAAAQFLLAQHYYLGDGTAKDEQLAFKWLCKSAEGGVAIAQVRLGVCHLKGEGTPINHQEAEKWFLLSANQGEYLAEYELGKFYLSEWQPQTTRVKAFYWLKKAADSRMVKPHYELGLCYEQGLGITKDIQQAFTHYSADLYDPRSRLRMGLLYRRGEEVPRDYAKAVENFRAGTMQQPADDHRSAVAENFLNLGLCLMDGVGVLRDVNAAVECLVEAAALGEPNAMWALGILHEFGRAVAQDTREAYAWYNLASPKLSKAKADLAKLEAKMTNIEVMAAQKRSSEIQAYLDRINSIFGERTVGLPPK